MGTLTSTDSVTVLMIFELPTLSTDTHRSSRRGSHGQGVSSGSPRSQGRSRCEKVRRQSVIAPPTTRARGRGARVVHPGAPSSVRHYRRPSWRSMCRTAEEHTRWETHDAQRCDQGSHRGELGHELWDRRRTVRRRPSTLRNASPARRAPRNRPQTPPSPRVGQKIVQSGY